MAIEISVALLFVIIAGGFGTLAMYYGYLAYRAGSGESELKMYTYFPIAMVSLGAFTIITLLHVAGILDLSPQKPLEALRELLLMIAAIFFALAFKDMYEFFKSFEE